MGYRVRQFDLDSKASGIDYISNDVRTMARALQGFGIILDNAPISQWADIEKIVRFNIKKMVISSKIELKSCAYEEIINPFYQAYFGRKGPFFVRGKYSKDN